MVKYILYRPLEGNDLKNSTEKNKEQSPKSKKYIGKNTQIKSQVPEPKNKTNFKGQCSDLENYIFDLCTRASEKFTKIIK